MIVVLSVGNHVITASISDSDGATDMQSRTVGFNRTGTTYCFVDVFGQ